MYKVRYLHVWYDLHSEMCTDTKNVVLAQLVLGGHYIP